MGVDSMASRCEIGMPTKSLKGLEDTMLTNPPVPYDFCVGVPISHLLTMESTPI